MFKEDDLIIQPYSRITGTRLCARIKAIEGDEAYLDKYARFGELPNYSSNVMTLERLENYYISMTNEEIKMFDEGLSKCMIPFGREDDYQRTREVVSKYLERMKEAEIEV